MTSSAEQVPLEERIEFPEPIPKEARKGLEKLEKEFIRAETEVGMFNSILFL